MRKRALLIVVAVFLFGAGGKLAHDAYQENERQKLLEALSTSGSCSACDLHKADLKRLREYKAQRSLLKDSAAK